MALCAVERSPLIPPDDPHGPETNSPGRYYYNCTSSSPENKPIHYPNQCEVEVVNVLKMYLQKSLTFNSKGIYVFVKCLNLKGRERQVSTMRYERFSRW
jgi:hypothetical protein